MENKVVSRIIEDIKAYKKQHKKWPDSIILRDPDLIDLIMAASTDARVIDSKIDPEADTTATLRVNKTDVTVKVYRSTLIV